MIRYIQQKNINYDAMENLLRKSQKSNQYTNMGPAKFALEKKLENLFSLEENKKIVCVANGTLALHSIFIYLQKIHNKKLNFVSPSFTFPSCVVGGYKTDLVDIEMQNYTIPLNDKNLDLYDGFIITNLFGTYPSNLLEWHERCVEKNKILILDNASSPLSTINNININNIGNFCFGSLHHTKFLGFGEGGYVVIDKEYYDEFNKILGFGFGTSSEKRKYSQYSCNFKMSDIVAAGIHQHINSYDIDKHIDVQNKLIEKIEKIKGIKVFNYNNGVVYGNLPLLYENPIDDFFFKDKNVECNKYYYPLKKHKNSFLLYDRIINLPLHCDLTEYEIDVMINILKRSSYEYNNGSW